jgi:putative ABC transport system permease protein
MNALGFAWRSLVRQPARAALGILGVAAVGALLFDMLLLSRGLIVSMQDLLDRGGWDVRVSAGDLPGMGLRIPNALETADTIARLPSVQAALVIRTASAQIDRSPGGSKDPPLPGGSPPVSPLRASFQGVTTRSTNPAGSRLRAPWTILRGRDAEHPDEIVVDEQIASDAAVAPGSEITIRASCVADLEALPEMRLKVVGVAEFPFQTSNESTAGGTLDALKAACGGNAGDTADLILVTSTGDAGATAAAIRAAHPELRAATNNEVVGRLQQTGFTYFRQISSVLTTVTVSFAVLLITVLLTVSVNQRLGEIAALRALGFSRMRVVKDVFAESVLIVGIGGLLSLPLGLLLASGLDRILKGMPGIPAALHFFVFERQALVVHVALLAATAIIASLYPMRIVSNLPIAATLRDEVIG